MRGDSGFTLVELMIALVLGLVIIGGVISVFLANKQSYRTNEALSQVQDHGRTAFEFLARDIRMAGLTGCGNTGRVANVLNDGPAAGGTEWYSDLSDAVRGFDGGQGGASVDIGTAEGERVNDTDMIQLMGVDGNTFSIEQHKFASAQFKINEPTTTLVNNDIVVVCDPDHAAVMQITSYNSNNVTVVHNTGQGEPGNCSKGLGFPTKCACSETGQTPPACVNDTVGAQYEFGKNSQLAKLAASAWYIGNNPANGRSLYRASLTNLSGTLTTQPTEMVRNVTDMQLAYHEAGQDSFVGAGSVGNWLSVDAVRVILTLQSEQPRAGTDQQALSRTLSTTVTIRNRVN
ncbi:prepilin-type N-terminal cleavage/methylation domain-containing protein [Guyparkeria sp. SCN-R1]|nr:prepilin-type N-terminal cleavage/methylation domain-containing protein [Guyparkeria sp. SCN-R1]